MVRRQQSLSFEERLHVAYVNLTFSCSETSEQDARRERLFYRLVCNRLASFVVYTTPDWLDPENQRARNCFLDFMQQYARILWPGSLAQRQHLAIPKVHEPKKTRSFIAEFDGKLAKSEGDMKESRLGKAFEKYVLVLLERTALEGVLPGDDVGWLVQEIVSLQMGAEYSPAMATQVGQNVSVKIEDDSE